MALWHAPLYRATFSGNGTAAFELPAQTSRITALVSGAAADLGGATLQIEATLDGVNYAPIPGGKDVQSVGALQPYEGKVHAARAVLTGYASSVVVTLVAEKSRSWAQNIAQDSDGAVIVTAVTPA